jgi:hypothetical protein
MGRFILGTVASGGRGFSTTSVVVTTRRAPTELAAHDALLRAGFQGQRCLALVGKVDELPKIGQPSFRVGRSGK